MDTETIIYENYIFKFNMTDMKEQLMKLMIM